MRRRGSAEKSVELKCCYVVFQRDSREPHPADRCRVRLVDQVGGATGASLLPPELPLDEPVPNSRPKKPEIAPKKSNMGEPFARTNAVTTSGRLVVVFREVPSTLTAKASDEGRLPDEMYDSSRFDTSLSRVTVT